MKYVLSLPVLFTGKRITLKQDVLKSNNGESFTYETVSVKEAVAVLPIIRNRIEGGQDLLLINNYRWPIRESNLEVPAGVVEGSDLLTDNPYLNCAKRELLEETGYACNEPDSFEYLGVFYTSPGITDEKIHLFIARDVVKVSDQKLDSQEEIKTKVVSLYQALKMIDDNFIRDLKSVFLITKYFNKFHNLTSQL
jgi:ADP-ribose pyrophosphatase